MDRLTPEALRARIRAAIGEPEPARGGFDLAPARAGWRRWFHPAAGTSPAALRVSLLVTVVAAVAAVLTVGTVLHLRSLPKPAGSQGGPAGTSLSTPSPSAFLGPALLGPAVEDFVPSDVTAVSANEWWVLGSDGAGCAGASCTRILHTLDDGQAFTSIPTPPAAVNGLRFRDPLDGWAFSATTVWSTHDGGATWSGTTLAGPLTELETSGDYVYVIVDAADPGDDWTLDRSPTTSDGWQVIANFKGEQPTNLSVHGNDLWLSLSSGLGVNQVWVSSDDAAQFTQTSICPGATGLVGLYAATTQDLWAACSTGSSDSVWRSIDGGQTFTDVASETGPLPVWDSIAGTSASSAVLAGPRLQLTLDGGESFQSVQDNGDDWTIVGFTTDEDGFALSYSDSSYAQPNGLWRTEDAGAQWYEVQFH
jgi:hypothetical protein